MFEFLFKKEDTPLDKLATVEAKLIELAESKNSLQVEFDELELKLTRSLVSEALADKAAAAESDKLTASMKKVERELTAATMAHAELTDQMPNLQAAAEEFKGLEFENAIKEAAAKKLKALPAAVKRAEKAAADYVKAMSEVAALSRQAASAVETATTDKLRAEYKSWRGFINFTSMPDYHYLTGLEAAEFQLKQISEHGSRAEESEKPYVPTDAEREAAKQKAMADAIAIQRHSSSEYQRLSTKDAA